MSYPNWLIRTWSGFLPNHLPKIRVVPSKCECNHATLQPMTQRIKTNLFTQSVGAFLLCWSTSQSILPQIFSPVSTHLWKPQRWCHDIVANTLVSFFINNPWQRTIHIILNNASSCMVKINWCVPSPRTVPGMQWLLSSWQLLTW